MAGEGTATGAKRDVGHGTVWVNDDIRYIAMQVSRLEALQGGQSHGFRDVKATAAFTAQVTGRHHAFE